MVKLMSVSELSYSYILVSSDIEDRVESLKNSMSTSRVVEFIRDDFLLDDSKSVVAEAYISESELKHIIICAKQLRTEAQNALLKILEEPPRNILFIIIVPSISVLLPTIRSRLIVKSEISAKERQGVDLSLTNLDLRSMFEFITSIERTDRHGAKELIQRLFYQATAIEKMKLNRAQLDAFDLAFRLLELNSNQKHITLMLLTHFLKERSSVS